MLKKKDDVFYGLDKRQCAALLAWLHSDDAKYLWTVLEEMAKNADKTALQPPKDRQDWHNYIAEQQRFIGQGIAYRRVIGIKQALGE